MKVIDKVTGKVWADGISACSMSEVHHVVFVSPLMRYVGGEEDTLEIDMSQVKDEGWDLDNIVLEYTPAERKLYIQTKISREVDMPAGSKESTALSIGGSNNNGICAVTAMLGSVVATLSTDPAAKKALVSNLEAITGASQAVAQADVDMFSKLGAAIADGTLVLPALKSTDLSISSPLLDFGATNAITNRVLKK